MAGRISEDVVQRHRRIAHRVGSSLVHLGPVRDRAQLRWLYENALASVTMSTLEAFPLTPAEAGSVGCPLVASDIPAHREVAGDAAFYVPPRDAAALGRVLAEEIFIGARRPRKWTWPVSWQDHAIAVGALFDEVRR